MRRATRRLAANEDLNITSLMDMFTIILVFLLKSFSTEDISVTPSSDLALPSSTTTQPAKLAVSVVVTRSQIVVDGVTLLPLTTAADPTNPLVSRVSIPPEAQQGQLIPLLQERLQQKADAAKAIATASAQKDHEFRGEVLLQCDKSLPFSVVRDVMYTAGQAQFADFRFVVYRSAEE